MATPPQETVVYYHIPKTAGVSLRNIIRRNYPAEGIVGHGADTHAFVAEFNSWPEDKLRTIHFMQGHYPFGIHQQLPQPSRCFTVLRNPTERVISYYYHAQRDPKHYLHHLINDNNWSIAQLIESGEALMMNDGQVRLLSAVWGDLPFNQIDNTIVTQAVKNLHRCDVVGITESFDATLLLLKQKFSWADIHYQQKANVGRNRQKTAALSATDLATIKHYNQGDQILYEEATRCFQAQCRSAGPFFTWQVRRFQTGLWLEPKINQLKRFSLRTALKKRLP